MSKTTDAAIERRNEVEAFKAKVMADAKKSSADAHNELDRLNQNIGWLLATCGEERHSHLYWKSQFEVTLETVHKLGAIIDELQEEN